MSNYPDGKDELRRFVSRVTDMIADDLNKLFDVAVALETELGVLPSGRMGTIFGRLFARGNLSRKDGKWRRLYWKTFDNIDSAVFDEEKGHHKLGFSSNRFRGIKTAHGDDTPAVFVQLLANGPNYQGWPWSLVLSVAKEDHVRVWGRDGLGGRIFHLAATHPNDPHRTDTKIGMLVWGMI